jgi:hypothetical protein
MRIISDPGIKNGVWHVVAEWHGHDVVVYEGEGHDHYDDVLNCIAFRNLARREEAAAAEDAEYYATQHDTPEDWTMRQTA